MSNFCSKCGKELKPGAVFCGGCGTSLASGNVADAGAKDGGVAKKPGREFAIASVVMPIVLFFATIILDHDLDGRVMFPILVLSCIGFIPLVLGVKSRKSGYKGFLPYVGIALSVVYLLMIIFALINNLIWLFGRF